MQPKDKVNVLLVDDHPENLLALEAILGSLGQNLVRATSGEQALRCLLNQDFAVILLDVQMPGMDGFETATLIRQRPSSRYTPIIFLTAFSTSDSFVFKGYSLGAVDYLLKPLEPEILLSKVAVFVDLFKKTEEVKRQATQLAAVNANLRKSEEQFRSLSACSPVGIFLTDIEGNCTYTNPRYQAIYGITLEESLGEGWAAAIHPDDREAVFSTWYTCANEGREYSDEFRVQPPHEDIVRWVNARSSPMLSAQGELIGYVGTVEDITERKAAEEARAQIIREQVARQEAEAANRVKDEFLATLSHELRTPLNSMLGWTQLLRSRKFDEKTTARALETIERNAKLQAQLIEDILDVSRIIRGKLNLNICQVNLIPIVEAAIDTLRLAAVDKEIQLDFVMDSSLKETDNLSITPLIVSGDPSRLQQVVWNLLSNAIKFTPAGGRVEVELSVVRKELLSWNVKTPTDSYAQIKVSDTGVGISADFLPYIFDRFRQADSTTTRRYGGLGLGLAIVRHLVELQGGTVFAQSEGEDQGATFIVNLPLPGSREVVSENKRGLGDQEVTLSPTPNCEHPITPSSHHSLTGLQVLVVDDDTDTRDFLTTVLEEYQMQVTAVGSVQEALLALEHLKPDVLVSDIGMPMEDGYGLIRKVRSLEAEGGETIPAIALSGYAKGEERSRSLEAGFQTHLPKPVQPAELIAMVAQLAQRENISDLERSETNT
ncbi:response regulator [Funiculus sociatus GB2-A5]|uniref:histidine kinase n=1 Tax=Funiculus sociatus GB2-A5 TaxID=2933946 RepID=A0ABV0JKX3_9CYAN|nr:MULTISPECIES: response regulator [unclassified Trichocoleus]MBD1906280.1 response regulator [Trichocoleus sp. FACHB-832]MBD2061445.1 response regulator [Trichocoleus sp. FACHB-6]